MKAFILFIFGVVMSSYADRIEEEESYYSECE